MSVSPQGILAPLETAGGAALLATGNPAGIPLLMSGGPGTLKDVGLGGNSGGMSLPGQGGGGGQMNIPPQIPKPFPAMQAPNMQQANIGTAQPVGVPMAGAMQRQPMQQGMTPQMPAMMQSGMGQPPPGAHQPVNPGADPNSLLMLQILRLMGQS